MSHSQGYDKIYEELRGYFPPEYDLTPDELEKEIEIENKKRELALGMMKVQHMTATIPVQGRRIARSSISSMHTNHDIPIVKPKATSTPAAAPVSAPVAETEVFAGKSKFTDPTLARKVQEAPDTDFSETGVIDLSAVNAEAVPEIVIDEALPEAPAPATEAESEDIPVIPVVDNSSPSPLDADLAPMADLFEEMENPSDYSLFEEDQEVEEINYEELKKARAPINFFFDFLEIFAVCITCIIVVFALFFRLTRVSGESMQDTLYEDEYLVVSDFFYEPRRGDIVVIQNTALESQLLKEPLVKRVIAVGGESVDIAENGMVTITHKDGSKEVLSQPYIKKEPYASRVDHWDVPEGYVFVMGDNRNHSTDSRSHLVGVVDERCIFGKALFRILPLPSFTVFENPYND